MEQPITDEFKIEAYRILTKRGPWKPTMYQFMLAARICIHTCFFILGVLAYIHIGSWTTLHILACLSVLGEYIGYILYRAAEVDRKHKDIIAQLEALRHDQERYMELMNRLVDDIERRR